MNAIKYLENILQDYAWGSEKDIQELLGRDDLKGCPVAEMWMGAHPKAPSMVDGKSLEEIIARDPEGILGSEAAGRFAGKLPFLFKVLAAGKPLSIQAHPNLEQAGAGYHRENEKGIELSAFDRTYKDDNHKPEIICALTPFWALNGFMPRGAIYAFFNSLNSAAAKGEFEEFAANQDDEGLRRFYASLLDMEDEKKQQLVKDILEFAENKSDDKSLWLIKLNETFPGDPGIISAAMLNLIRLEPGEAMYLPACQLHAYLDGLGIELMANSDNVLRGGLTPKYVNVPELLRILNFTAPVIKILTPEKNDEGKEFYQTPADEFLLARIRVTKNKSFTTRGRKTVSILICTRGKGTIKAGNCLAVKKGNSLFVPAGVSGYTVTGDLELFEATVPEE